MSRELLTSADNKKEINNIYFFCLKSNTCTKIKKIMFLLRLLTYIYSAAD